MASPVTSAAPAITPIPATTTTTTTTTTTITTTTVPPTIPAALDAFGIESVTVGDQQWLVAVANDSDLRYQGLRRINDLGALDGMLFVWEEASESSFTMRTVPIQLDIGFFDSDGTLFEVVSMFPCGDSDDCPLYGASSSFRFAVERPAGGWGDIDLGALLVREN